MQKTYTVSDDKSTGQLRVKSKFILLHSEDNILVCCRPANEGESIVLGGEKFVLMQTMKLGHKIARRTLCKGDKIVKYGVSIGSAVQDISPGEHVHLHNMKSDYIPPHTRERLHEISDYK